MKKILFVIPTLGAGGAERSLVNLLNELPKDLFSVDLLTFKEDGVFNSQIPTNINVLSIPYELKKLYSPLSKAGGYAVIKIIGNVAARIFEHSYCAQREFLWRHFYSKFIRKLNTKYDVAVGYLGGESTDFVVDKVDAKLRIHWVHNDYKNICMPKKYDKNTFKLVDAIITVSDECLEILKSEFPEFKSKMFCIENITSPNIILRRAKDFYPNEYKDKDKIILLSIGRLSEQKGFDLAISAAQIMKQNKLDFKWFIIGEGELRKKLQSQIVSLGLENSIELLGVRDNPYPYILNCDVFVQPSRFEGKSVVLDEAKILSKPIVVTNYPTVIDQIHGYTKEYIVEAEPEEIAKGIEKTVREFLFMQTEDQGIGNYDNGYKNALEKHIKLFEGEKL